MMLVVLISSGLFFIGIIAVAVWHQANSGPSQTLRDALLEGATLSHIPSLDRLLFDANARESIQEKVVELGFNSCANIVENRDVEYQTAEIFLIDDGGGVHTVEQVTVSTASTVEIANLEEKAMELAKLLGVQLKT